MSCKSAGGPCLELDFSSRLGSKVLMALVAALMASQKSAVFWRVDASLPGRMLSGVLSMEFGRCIPWLCHRSALRQDKRAEALKECVKMINAPGGGCCTVFPYEAAIWLLEEQEELVGTNKRSINRCCTCCLCQPLALAVCVETFRIFVKHANHAQCAQAYPAATPAATDALVHRIMQE